MLASAGKGLYYQEIRLMFTCGLAPVTLAPGESTYDCGVVLGY